MNHVNENLKIAEIVVNYLQVNDVLCKTIVLYNPFYCFVVFHQLKRNKSIPKYTIYLYRNSIVTRAYFSIGPFVNIIAITSTSMLLLDEYESGNQKDNENRKCYLRLQLD